MENQIKNISQLRKKRLDMKSEKIQKQTTKIEQNKQILLKKTEYIYNLLLKWSDSETKNEQKRRKKTSLPKKKGKKGGLMEASTLKDLIEDNDMSASKLNASHHEKIKKNGTLKPKMIKEGSTNVLLNKLKTLKRGYTEKFKTGSKEKKKIVGADTETFKYNKEKDPILVTKF